MGDFDMYGTESNDGLSLEYSSQTNTNEDKGMYVVVYGT
jgi:hypothetical protein